MPNAQSVSRREEDVRECTLAACHRVGLYSHIQNHNSSDFLDRPTQELIVSCETECPIGPPYNDCLNTFKQRYHACLADKGYTKVRLYLQRLCDGQDWDYFCRYHQSRVWRSQ